MNLYNLTTDMLSLKESLQEGEVSEEFEIKSEEFELKADGYAKVIRTLQGEAEIIENEIKQLESKKRATENAITRLKLALQNAMTALDKKKFKTPLFSFWVQGNRPAVDVYDIKKIPPEYWKQPEPVLNKKELLEHLCNGVIVEGAGLAHSESLRIR